MNDNEDKKQNRATASEVQEVLAFTLAYNIENKILPTRKDTTNILTSENVEYIVTPREEYVDYSIESFRERWQQDEDLRHKYRDFATNLTLELEESGLSTRASSSDKVRKTIQFIVTIPARTAYGLPGNNDF